MPALPWLSPSSPAVWSISKRGSQEEAQYLSSHRLTHPRLPHLRERDGRCDALGEEALQPPDLGAAAREDGQRRQVATVVSAALVSPHIMVLFVVFRLHRRAVGRGNVAGAATPAAAARAASANCSCTLACRRASAAAASAMRKYTHATREKEKEPAPRAAAAAAD